MKNNKTVTGLFLDPKFVIYLIEFLDPVAWVKAARTHRSLSDFFANENKEFWEKCVKRDISDSPKPRLKKKSFKENRMETYKEMYGRVYSRVILEIKSSQDESPENLFQLFFKVVLHGFEKFDTQFPNLFSPVNMNTAFIQEPFTVLNIAAQRGYTGLLQYILYQGADVNMTVSLLVAMSPIGAPTRHPGKSALMYAVKANETKCVSILIEAKADVDYRAKSLDTALHKAAKKGYVDCVKTLLEAKASTNMTNFWGRRALDVAPKDSECHQLIMDAMKKSTQPPGQCLVM